MDARYGVHAPQRVRNHTLTGHPVMKYNTLGNTGLFVSKLFGTMTFVAVKPPLRKRLDAIE